MSAQNNGEQLNDACNTGNFPSVRSLVSSGASVDYQNKYSGYTPAIHCCRRGHSEILQFILEQGANAELVVSYGWTPLIYAAARNKYECVAVLVRYGVVLDAINKDGWTALWHASRGGYLPIVELLAQSGADIERASNDGKTPIVIARERGHTAVVTYLSIELNWRRRRNYATVLNSLKGAPTTSKTVRALQCYDVARVIGSYL